MYTEVGTDIAPNFLENFALTSNSTTIFGKSSMENQALKSSMLFSPFALGVTNA